MTPRILPTPQFASLIYGQRGVPLDDPAETFHEASRLYPSMAPERLDVLHELEQGGELARATARASRTHDHRPGIALPRAAPLRGRLGDLLARRRSARGEVERPLLLTELAAVLDASYASEPRTGGEFRRPVPSAGALYPLEVYVVAASVRGLEPGLYHLQPFRRRLCLLAPPDGAAVRRALVDPAVADVAAAFLFVTGVFSRSRFKYGQRGYRFTLLEAGHLVQAAVLAATDLDLPALPIGGFYDRRLDALLGADGLDEASLYALALGGAL